MMHSKLILIIFVVAVVSGCRKKSSDDYNYYKPYKADSISTVEKAAQIEEEEPKEIVEVVKEIKGVDLNDNYFLVVSSYTIEEFAEAQKKDLVEQGYKPAIIMVDDDGWFKLAVESYKTLDEAKAALPALKSKSGIFEQARIVFKKDK